MTIADDPPPGAVYPPRNLFDIAAYDLEEVFDGYMAQEADEPLPGDNHSPAYRWGATNNLRDRQIDDDGFDGLRQAYLAARRIIQ